MYTSEDKYDLQVKAERAGVKAVQYLSHNKAKWNIYLDGRPVFSKVKQKDVPLLKALIAIRVRDL